MNNNCKYIIVVGRIASPIVGNDVLVLYMAHLEYGMPDKKYSLIRFPFFPTRNGSVILRYLKCDAIFQVATIKKRCHIRTHTHNNKKNITKSNPKLFRITWLLLFSIQWHSFQLPTEFSLCDLNCFLKIRNKMKTFGKHQKKHSELILIFSFKTFLIWKIQKRNPAGVFRLVFS